MTESNKTGSAALSEMSRQRRLSFSREMIRAPNSIPMSRAKCRTPLHFLSHTYELVNVRALAAIACQKVSTIRIR
jgi:hypothetical protein